VFAFHSTKVEEILLLPFLTDLLCDGKEQCRSREMAAVEADFDRQSGEETATQIPTMPSFNRVKENYLKRLENEMKSSFASSISLSPTSNLFLLVFIVSFPFHFLFSLSLPF
jgi:hypothetical protein